MQREHTSLYFGPENLSFRAPKNSKETHPPRPPTNQKLRRRLVVVWDCRLPAAAPAPIVEMVGWLFVLSPRPVPPARLPRALSSRPARSRRRRRRPVVRYRPTEARPREGKRSPIANRLP